MNYIVAVTLTMLVLKPDLSNPQVFLPTWWLFAALGILLPSVFVIMGKSVDAAGIVKSDAAQRLSLFLPIVASFTLFHEQLTEGRFNRFGIGIYGTVFLALEKRWRQEIRRPQCASNAAFGRLVRLRRH